MIEQTNDDTKARLGWVAYIGGIARALRGSPPANVGISIDGATPVHYRAVGVLVGNVGHLQAGLTLLPAASPTDGVLDVAVLAPATWRDWPLILARIVLRRVARGGRTDVLRGSRVDITCDRPLPLEFDGDLAGQTQSLTVAVLPGALVVCVPT
jgi:diacylglycerol kinase family enzyme